MITDRVRGFEYGRAWADGRPIKNVRNLTGEENVEFGLFARGLSKAVIPALIQISCHQWAMGGYFSRGSKGMS